MTSASAKKNSMSCAPNELAGDGRPRKGSSSRDDDKPELQILIMGKTGNGKSSVGNKILGKPQFKVTSGILSATTQTRLAVSDLKYRGRKLKMHVIDFPDVADCDLPEAERQKQIDLCKTLTHPYPTAVCLVVRADVRFTPEEYANYLETKKVLGDRIRDNLLVVFTMADKLPPDLRDNFKRELQQTNQQLQRVIKESNNRYVLLSNIIDHHGEDEALSQLSELFLRLHDQCRSVEQRQPERACDPTPGTADAKTAGQPTTVGQPQTPSQGHKEDRVQRAQTPPKHSSWMKCTML